MNTSHEIAIEEEQINNEQEIDPGIMQKLPGILRTLGTGVLLIAMYSFVIKGWQSGNDVIRYLMMLGHTGVLAAIGLASGHWLKDGKGARLLFALALVSVPANFAILGAFIFSQTGAVDISFYPNYAAWSVESLTAAIATSAGAMLILIPIIMLGFTVLARSVSKKLSMLFLFSNAALLIPLRDPQLVAALVVALISMSIFFSSRASHENIAIRTREGITAIGLQFLPLTVLMVRSLWLYSADDFLLTVLAATVFFMIRQASFYLEPGSKWRNTLDGVSVLPSLAIIPFLGETLTGTTLVAESLVIPITTLASAGMIYDISKRSQNSAAVYRNIAVVIVLLSTVFNLFAFSGLLAALSCITIGAGLLVLGYQNQYRNVFSSGATLSSLGLLHQAYELVHHFHLGSWASMAVLGIVAILLAATIESQASKLKSSIKHWSSTYKNWES